MSHYEQPHAVGPQHHPHAGGAATVTDTVGSFEGLHFKIDHRDSNSVLAVRLQPGYSFKGKPGAMIAMDPSVTLKGKLKLSFKKLITGGEMAESTFTGPGEVLLAPEVWGDIIPLHLDGCTPWMMGKDAFLACTPEVQRTTKSQGFGKALFSGEGLFVAHLQGQGIAFIQSLGAIIKRELRQGEEWIVDNGHLVAWSAGYKVERVGGGMLSSMHSGEGLVCRFTGPGTVYIQSRNPEVLGEYIAAKTPSSG